MVVANSTPTPDNITGNPQITAVRLGHELNEDALVAYLADTLGPTKSKLKIKQFEGGQSNPTFLLNYNASNYVLRKQPPGELLPSAHQVNREYKVMKALANTAVPVPKMIALCEDKALIGTHFYLMEYVEGRVFSDSSLPAFTAEERTKVYHQLIDILAALHQVPYAQVGLENIGRKGNYIARQIARWSKQYIASKTEEIEAMDKLIEWLPENIPAGDETVLVHGDYRIGNMIFAPKSARIIAILDWELSTLGNGLSDLGYVCMDYHAKAQVAEHASIDGIPTEAEQVARYCAKTKHKPPEKWNFYIAYNLFRGAAIIQGVYKRGLDGNASSEMALSYADACKERAALAWQLAEQVC